MPSSLLKFEKKLSVKIGGRRYPVVKIGNQLWLAENLDWKWDGLIIGENVGSSPRANYYNNDEITYGINGYDCGLLYNFSAVQELGNLLSDGWHIPSNNEWEELIISTQDTNNAAYLLSNGNIEWASNWSGENMFGFNMKPCGQRYGSNGGFYEIGSNILYWDSSRYAYYRNGTKFLRDYCTNNSQYYIRLVKSIE
ncbi:MAG: FISUMP domain-containing protein [Methanosphaera sp.]|nr:FISUMP domain-containing protein [Methanosphaera sp.]